MASLPRHKRRMLLVGSALATAIALPAGCDDDEAKRRDVVFSNPKGCVYDDAGRETCGRSDLVDAATEDVRVAAEASVLDDASADGGDARADASDASADAPNDG